MSTIKIYDLHVTACDHDSFHSCRYYGDKIVSKLIKAHFASWLKALSKAYYDWLDGWKTHIWLAKEKICLKKKLTGQFQNRHKSIMMWRYEVCKQISESYCEHEWDWLISVCKYINFVCECELAYTFVNHIL